MSYKRGMVRRVLGDREVIGIWKSATDWGWLQRVVDCTDHEEDPESGQESCGRLVQVVSSNGGEDALASFQYPEMPETIDLPNIGQAVLHFFTSQGDDGLNTLDVVKIGGQGVVDFWTWR